VSGENLIDITIDKSLKDAFDVGANGRGVPGSIRLAKRDWRECKKHRDESDCPDDHVIFLLAPHPSFLVCRLTTINTQAVFLMT
jgi:hypothetical protein